MQTFWQDLRYGARTLLKQPGFTLLAVLTLALGIGSTTTIFSAIQNILLDPFPYTDAHRMVVIQIHDTSNPRPRGRAGFQTLEFLDYQEQNHVFEDIMGATGGDVLYNNGAEVEQFFGCYVTPNTFSFLGVPAQLGRGITPDDARPGAPPVFVMAHKLWANRFNLDPTILGKTFTLNGTPTTLVGIMPPRFSFYFPDLWIARAMERGDPGANRQYWFSLAKLKPGVTIQQAQADIDRIAGELRHDASDRQSALGSIAARSADAGRGGYRGGAGRFGGVLFPGAARHEGRPVGGAKGRVRSRMMNILLHSQSIPTEGEMHEENQTRLVRRALLRIHDRQR